MEELYEAARKFLAAWEAYDDSARQAYRIATAHAVFSELYYAQYDEHLWNNPCRAIETVRELLPEIKRCPHCGGWPVAKLQADC